MMMVMVKVRVKVKLGVGTCLVLSISSKGTARFNVPVRRTNCYQQYNILYLLNIQYLLRKGFAFSLIEAIDAQSSF